MFYLIGLGLGDARDISVKGLEIVRRCEAVYLEAYTSILTCGAEALEELYGRPVTLADRETVEQGMDSVISGAAERDVALLVVGDPFAATTHHDLVLRARQRGVPCRVVHSASIMTAVGCCGLQLYSYGETVSIPFWTETWQPHSFVEKIDANLERGQHTLCLLDIKVKEQSVENLLRGRKVYEPPRFMRVAVAAQQLLEVVKGRATSHPGLTPEARVVGLARVGTETERVIVCSLREMVEADLGPPLHSLVVVGKTHPMELEYLEQFHLTGDEVKELAKLEQKQARLEEETARLNLKAAMLDQKTAKYEQQAAMWQQQTATLKQQTAKLKQETAKWEQKTATLNEKTAILEQKVANFEQKASNFEQKTAKYEQEMAKSELEAVNPELEAAKSELEAAKSELEVAESELEVAKSELEAVMTEQGCRFLFRLAS